MSEARAGGVKCGARTRTGGTCAKQAGWGTDHLGSGNCKLHGGSTRGGTIHAAKLQAIQLAEKLHVEPHEALLRTLAEASWWRDYCRDKVAALEPDDVVVRSVRERVWAGGESGNGGGVETITSEQVQLHLWVKQWHEAIERVARLAKTAIDAGIAERQVRVVEMLGAELADVIGGILSDLKLTPAQKKLAPASVERHLRLLEGGRAA